jgi:uncharacterized protein (DUF952 family)
MTWVFKIADAATWAAVSEDGAWAGTEKDQRDGFVHLSAKDQVAGTLAKHYPGREGLLLLWIDAAALPPDALRWEPSRGGAPFPHLYAALRRDWVSHADPLPVEDEVHRLPWTEGHA